MNGLKFKDQEVLNLHQYFDTDYSYNEEFDTPDGQHWKGRVAYEDWTPEILQLAIDNEVVEP